MWLSRQKLIQYFTKISTRCFQMDLLRLMSPQICNQLRLSQWNGWQRWPLKWNNFMASACSTAHVQILGHSKKFTAHLSHNITGEKFLKIFIEHRARSHSSVTISRMGERLTYTHYKPPASDVIFHNRFLFPLSNRKQEHVLCSAFPTEGAAKNCKNFHLVRPLIVYRNMLTNWTCLQCCQI